MPRKRSGCFGTGRCEFGVVSPVSDGGYKDDIEPSNLLFSSQSRLAVLPAPANYSDRVGFRGPGI